MKKILVTGASGFIGSSIVERAMKRGYEVYAGVRKTSSKKYLQQDGLHFFEMDFSKKENLSNQLKDAWQSGITFDYIIHNAGITYARKREDFNRVNFEYARNFLEALKEIKAIPKKFILISSLSTHGPGDENSFEPINISHEQNPISSYAKSKLLAENVLISSEDFPYIILRPTAVYGPRDPDFLTFVKMINRSLEIYIGRKSQRLSLLHVEDLAKAILLAVESPLINKTYLVSDGNYYDSKELGGIIRQLLNKKTISFSIPKSFVGSVAGITEAVGNLFGVLPFLNKEKINEITALNWSCDIEPIKNDLQFSPDINLKEGMKKTIEWYRMNHLI